MKNDRTSKRRLRRLLGRKSSIIGLASVCAMATSDFAMAQAFVSNNAGNNAAPAATGTDSSAGGYGSVASGNQGIALGSLNRVTGVQSTGLGNDVRVTGNTAIGIGGDDSAVGIAAATLSGSSVTYSAATGAVLNPADFTPTLASGNMSMAIGAQSQATADFSTVVGWHSTASGIASLAVGDSTVASGIGASALGAGATATTTNSVALGTGSVASRAGLTGAAELFSGTLVASTQGAVSVGAPGAERQIINVAGGTQPTDAVNVRQLRTVGANLAAAIGSGANFDVATGAFTAPSFTVRGSTYATVGAAINALGTGGTGAFSSDNTAGALGPISTGANSSAGGYGSVATGAGATAVGNGSTALGAGSTVIGNGATDNASLNAVALGSNASALGVGAMALGRGAATTGDFAIAQGFGANVASAGGIAIGQAAAVTGLSGPGSDIAIGKNAKASELSGTFSAIAIGYQSSATTTGFGGPIALGYNAQANITTGTVGSPIAIGWSANATSTTGTGSAVAIGDRANATGTDAIAIGGHPGSTGSSATGDQSIAIGQSVSAGGTGSIGIGFNTTAGTNGGDVAIGNGASATIGNSVALGAGSVATRAGLGGAAEAFSGTLVASTQGAVSVGSAGNERQITNVAGGTQATDAVNVRQLRSVGTNLATSLGSGAGFDATTGTYTAPVYTVGGQTYNNVGAALAAGNALSVQYTPDGTGAATNVIDLTKGGTLAPVTMTGLANATTATGAVTLGQSPLQYSTAAAPTTANPAVPSNDVTLVGANAGAPIALHNLAAGTLAAGSTDAVNGGQLYTTNQNLAALTNGTAGLVQQAGPNTAITVGAATGGTSVGFANNIGAARTLTGVAAGTVAANSTEAINGGQLAGTAGSVATALGGGSTVNPDGTISAPTYNVANGTYNDVGSALTALNNGISSGRLGAFVSNNTSNRAAPLATGADASAGGFGASATGANSMVLGGNATDNGAANATVLGSNGSVTQAGGVALGFGSAATRAALAGANEAFSGTSVGSTQAAVSVGAVGAERQITNVAGGTQDTDAVNLRQLRAVGTNVATSLGGGAGFDATTGAYTAPTYTVGGQAYNNVGAALAAGNALSVQYTPNGAGGATNAIDLTKGGTLAPVTMSGLAAGALTATSTDAVNGSQLFATNQQLAAIAGGTSGLVQQDPVSRGITVGAATDGTTVGFANNAGAARTLTGVAAGQIAAGSTQAVNGGQLAGTAGSVATALGGGAAVNPDGTVSAPTYAVGGTTYNNVGGAITALDSTGVKYDAAPGGGRGQSITLAGGDPNQPVVIHNVAAGTARTDAANFGQVQDAEARANQYTNQRVAGLENEMGGISDRLSGLQSDIQETKREARQGAAIGLAAASLRYDDRPGKISVAAGAGYWRGEAAGAFGLGYTLPDGRFRINGTVATTGSAVGAGAGATYTFN